MTPILVNGREVSVEGASLDYADVVDLAFPDGARGLATVTWHHPMPPPTRGMHVGSMVPGDCIPVRADLRFDVVVTGAA